MRRELQICECLGQLSRVPFALKRLTCRRSSNVPSSNGAGLGWCCFFDFVDGVSSSSEDACFGLLILTGGVEMG